LHQEKSKNMNIVLTGSVGHISKPLAQELIAKGHSVTVISSKAEKQKNIEALGVTPAIGKIEAVNFLTKTFTGADIVYLMEPPAEQSLIRDPNFTMTALIDDIKQIVTNYKQAILQSGVKKVVHFSSIGAHTDKGNGLLKFHFYAENILKELTADVSIKSIRPSPINSGAECDKNHVF
jgi:uncharacterized protein YbjT (DUF2867 family)